MNEKLSKIEAFAQRGLNDKQIMLSVGLTSFTKEEREVIERGRTAGIALVHDKMFSRAMNGDSKAVDYLMKKFEEIQSKSLPPQESYFDKQLRILRSVNK